VFGHAVACPLHNWTIELEDGCARAPDKGCVKKFQVKKEGEHLYLNALEINVIET
jgi:nitrite reductase (NADH) small subunit